MNRVWTDLWHIRVRQERSEAKAARKVLKIRIFGEIYDKDF